MPETPELPPGAIRHDGGPCQVPLDSRPTVILRDGRQAEGQEADYWGSWWEWQDGGRQLTDIVGVIPDPNYLAPVEAELPDAATIIRDLLTIVDVDMPEDLQEQDKRIDAARAWLERKERR